MTLARTLALAFALTAAAARSHAASGGPDPFGYTWCDSDEPGNNADVPAFVPQDLRALGFRSDDTVIAIDLPAAAFPAGFPFYGTRYSRFWLSSNGWLSFMDPGGMSTPISTRLPSPQMPNAMIAFFWTDLTLETSVPKAEGGVNVALDGYTFSMRVAPFSTPGSEAELFVTLYSDGCIKLVYRGDVLTMKATAEVAIEDAPGTVGLPYMETGLPVGGASFRADYAVLYSVGGSCCGKGCLTEEQPPRLENVLHGRRSGRDASFSWTAPAFDGLGFRLYKDGDPQLPATTRVQVAETAMTVNTATDSGALDRSPLPLGFYQVVGVSCLGTLESPY